MKKYGHYIIIVLAFFVFLSFTGIAESALTGKEAHERYIYPSVRVSVGYGGGSGTVVYSKLSHPIKKSAIEVETAAGKIIIDGAPTSGEKWSTYILTNHHVIASAISIKEERDSDLGKKVKKEKRGIVYVEIFKYRDLSTPVGTMKVEADIVIYDADGDTALLKLRMDDPVLYVSKMPAMSEVEDLRVMDESIAVGCSLGYPPLPTVGVITRLNLQIDSLPYHMSSAQIIFGNSGGSMYKTDGTFVGIPSKVAAAWRNVITHMGLFVPVKRIYEWLEKQHYDFIYDPEKNETDSLKAREEELEKKKDKANSGG